jgi:hypothetical protein
MRSGNVEFGAGAGELPRHAGSDHDPVRRFLRFYRDRCAFSASAGSA